MIPSLVADDRMQRAFAPTRGGVVALTDQLLAACVDGHITIERVGERCFWAETGVTSRAEVPIPPSAFRTILARVAVLCNEHTPDSVSPYGGEGCLTIKASPPAVVRVAFVNTPDQQRLELRPELRMKN